jgi:hypothetical protein
LLKQKENDLTRVKVLPKMHSSLRSSYSKEYPMLSTTMSVDRLAATTASTKGFMSSTSMSFRPMTQMSLGLFSCTSSNNLVPSLKSSYLPDFEKTYRTLDFGVAGRNGIVHENKAIA